MRVSKKIRLTMVETGLNQKNLGERLNTPDTSDDAEMIVNTGNNSVVGINQSVNLTYFSDKRIDLILEKVTKLDLTLEKLTKKGGD